MLPEFDRRPRGYGRGFEINRVLSQRDAPGLGRGGSPAARNEQQMGCAIHELRARGTRLLKPLEFISKGAIA